MSGPADPPLPDLWRAFAATHGIVLLIGWWMRPEVAAPSAASFSWLLLGLTPVVTAVWATAPRWLSPDKAADPRGRALARWVCAETVGLFGLAVLVYGGPAWLGTALVGWGLVLVAAAPPEEA
ncbi:MAG: hypothetical protein R3F59_03880 [Myxococcota bacterium]